MNKSRLEAFSDGVFAIVVTLLVLDLRVPQLQGSFTNAELWNQLVLLWPVFGSFLLSFLVVSVFWINHHFLFNSFVSEVNRYINLLNVIYLLFLVLVPFSANLFGEYPESQLAVVLYGLNILANVFILRIMIKTAQVTGSMSKELPSRIVRQSRIRANITAGSYVLGIAAAFLYIPASIFFYIFPMLFNIIPGTLNAFERVFGFEIT